jgi:flavin-dependent dehydrogenase
MNKHYQLAVIGSGGKEAALSAARNGLRVGLIERGSDPGMRASSGSCRGWIHASNTLTHDLSDESSLNAELKILLVSLKGEDPGRSRLGILPALTFGVRRSTFGVQRSEGAIKT